MADARSVACVAGTYDTKRAEHEYLRDRIAAQDIAVLTVDLSTSGKGDGADISAETVAIHHPEGRNAVFTGDRGSAIIAMAEAFARFVQTRPELGGLISAGGSGGTSLATPAMRALPIGIPKVMVSTLASGNVAPYVGPADICMIYPVTDVQGLNRISEQVLANAAHALAGMMKFALPPRATARPAIGLTMFGVTTPCVQAVTRKLEGQYDCLVFHATGTGGQSFEKLIDSGAFVGVLDITTTEIADLLMGGILSAGEDRLGAIIRTKIPYVGSVGALDMVNFAAKGTVPARYAERNLYVHGPHVTLMRTTPEENARIGAWIAERLNRMEGPVRFLLPRKGVSLIDMPGKPFHDPAADEALFSAIEKAFKPAANRRLVSLDLEINDPKFADALVGAFREIVGLRDAG
jgi:uncharacterized protein (UPF0261 family)